MKETCVFVPQPLSCDIATCRPERKYPPLNLDEAEQDLVIFLLSSQLEKHVDYKKVASNAPS